MSGQDRMSKIISDLKVLSLLNTGQTLSTSTMTIIPHNSWSSSVWRRYAGEDRKQTISHIKGLFTETLTILKFNYNEDIYSSLESAIKGVSSLKETYKGDYYIIGEIDRIIENTHRDANIIKQTFYSSQYHLHEITSEDLNFDSSDYREQTEGLNSVTNEENIDSDLEQRVEQVVRTELSKTLDRDDCNREYILDEMRSTDINSPEKFHDSTIHQKICSDTNYKGKSECDDGSENTSNIEKMVSTSDRRSGEETTKNTIKSSSKSDYPENNNVMCYDPPLHMIDNSVCKIFYSSNDVPQRDNDSIENTFPQDSLNSNVLSDTERIKQLVKSSSDKIAKVVIDTANETRQNITSGIIDDSAVSKTQKSTSKTESPVIPVKDIKQELIIEINMSENIDGNDIITEPSGDVIIDLTESLYDDTCKNSAACFALSFKHDVTEKIQADDLNIKKYIGDTEPLSTHYESYISTEINEAVMDESDTDDDDQSDDFIKNIREKKSAGTQNYVRQYPTQSTTCNEFCGNYSEHSLANALSKNQKETRGHPKLHTGTKCVDDGNTIYLPMEYDSESQGWIHNGSVEYFPLDQSDTDSIREKQNEYYRNSIGSSFDQPGIIYKCPAFNSERTKSTGLVEENIPPVPILKLAKAFKCWVETVATDSDNEEYNKGGGVISEPHYVLY